jgi:hypothetical protein
MNDLTRDSYKSQKCANIISCMKDMYNISMEMAADIYYNSETAELIDDEVADLHCRSDKYLATLIWEEYLENPCFFTES